VRVAACRVVAGIVVVYSGDLVAGWTWVATMSGLAKLVLVVLVVALLLVGLPVGMPMAAMPSCPQCVPAADAVCLLVAALATLVVLIPPQAAARRVGWLVVRAPACLWTRPLERPPQALPRLS
jgi:hypothetical protein